MRRPIEPGSDGVQFAAVAARIDRARNPNDDVRAAFSGLSLHHDRRHLVRAVMEGVALNLAWLRPAVESFVGNEFSSVRFGGGGAQSDLWAQMLADASDRPVDQLEEPRATNARGAAFLAFATLGKLSLDDVPSLLRHAGRFASPIRRTAERMDAALRPVDRASPSARELDQVLNLCSPTLESTLSWFLPMP